MSRKLVAIGGGENARLKADGSRYPYETGPMDEEIIRLTGKSSPNFLFIAHAQKPDGERRYYETMKYIYNGMYGCDVKILRINDLADKALVKKLTDWADIIYEGGGDTQSMIKLWQSSGFDKILYHAWCGGKVLCGVSAGAMCWFASGASDSLKIQLNDDNAAFIDVESLDFIHAYYTPHCDEQGRLEAVKSLIKNHSDLAALSVSNCAAIEIVDDKYKIIINNQTERNIVPFVQKSYWLGDKYITENIDNTDHFESLDDLIGIK